ncbi:MAG: glutaredoxin family protein [Candidatus Altiarchaeota archaeon]
MADRKVLVYSTPACPYCRMAKDYLSRKSIAFKDIDIAADREKAKEMIELSGQMGVPQIVIGKNVIVGYDPDEIENALKHGDSDER